MNERGSALILVVMLVAILAGLGIALHFQALSELEMSTADGRSKQTFYLAEAGVEAGRQGLFNTNGDGPFGDDLVTAAGTDTALSFDPTTVSAVYATDGTVSSLTGYGDDVPLVALTALGEGWYAAFLTNDPGNGGGVTSTTDDNDRVLITGVGVARDGAIRVVEAVVEPTTPFPGDFPSVVSMFGDSPTFNDANDSDRIFKGDDCDGAGIPGFNVPVFALMTTTAEGVVESSLTANTVYTSGGEVGHMVVVNANDSSDPGIVDSDLGTIDAAWNDCENFLAMADEVKANADHVCSPGPSCSFPTPAPGNVLFVDGDLNLTASMSGAGLLWVTGRLTMEAAASWDGLIIVAGEGEFYRTGLGSGTVSGSTVVADVAGADNTFGTSDDCATGFNPAVFDESAGDEGLTTYCNADVLAATPITRYAVVGFRQR